MRLKSLCKWLLVLVALAGSCYGVGRLYFRITDGFVLSNTVRPEFRNEERWEIASLNESNQKEVDAVLDQDFTYLGKGCQSYVFLSDDGKYVLKFFKYQRYRTKPWLDFFAFISPIDRYRQKRMQHKLDKIERFYTCWKVAFEHLKDETGLVFVHLNTTSNLFPPLTIYDKVGRKHSVYLDEMQFLIQRKAEMIAPAIDRMMGDGELEQTKALLDNLVTFFLSEYERGYADNDHALMQNTGIIEGNPIHVDVGQLDISETFKDPDVYHQELFNKTYKFRIWLRENHPPLARHLEERLYGILGEALYTWTPTHLPGTDPLPRQDITQF